MLFDLENNTFSCNIFISIKVDRLENKRKLPTFEPPSETLNQSPYLPISRIDQPYGMT